MANPTLTKILIAVLVCTFVMATLFVGYSDFTIRNNATIDQPYKSAFGNISAQYSSTSVIANQASNQSLVTNILDFGKNAITGTVNVFVIGLDAMGKFFSLIPIIGNIFNAISFAIPWLSGLMGLALIISIVYIAMRYIQSVSNKFELP